LREHTKAGKYATEMYGGGRRGQARESRRHSKEWRGERERRERGARKIGIELTFNERESRSEAAKKEVQKPRPRRRLRESREIRGEI